MKKLRPVMITWQDTISGNRGWLPNDDLAALGNEPFHACGFLTATDDKFYTLVALIDSDGDNGPWVKIPRGCVLKIKYLR